MGETDFASDIERRKRQFIERCTLCGACLKECRLRPSSRYADRNPAELQRARIDFLRGGEFSQEIYDMAFSCSGCHYCSEFCEQGLDSSRMGTILRNELVGRGHAAPPLYSFLLPSERFSYFNIVSALVLHPSRIRWLTEVPDAPEHVDMVYVPGTGMHAAPHRMFTSLDILDRMGVNYVTLAGNAFSCGCIYGEAGRAVEAAEYAKRLMKSLSAFTPGTVVSYDPGTTLQLRRIADSSPGTSFRPMHLATFLGENLDRLTFENSVNRIVTIHDPCHLGRGLGEFEGVRKVLGAIPGIEIAEMKHSGKNTVCCGQGASMTEPRAAKAVGTGILDEAEETGADVLIDICPGCDGVFKKLGGDRPFEVVNFLTLVGRAMGIEYEDRLSVYLEWKDVDRVVEDARANIEASPYSEQEVRSFLELLFGTV